MEYLLRLKRVGTVITLLSTEQVHHYKAMLRKIDNTFVRRPAPSGREHQRTAHKSQAGHWDSCKSGSLIQGKASL